MNKTKKQPNWLKYDSTDRHPNDEIIICSFCHVTNGKKIPKLIFLLLAWICAIFCGFSPIVLGIEMTVMAYCWNAKSFATMMRLRERNAIAKMLFKHDWALNTIHCHYSILLRSHVVLYWFCLARCRNFALKSMKLKWFSRKNRSNESASEKLQINSLTNGYLNEFSIKKMLDTLWNSRCFHLIVESNSLILSWVLQEKNSLLIFKIIQYR